MAGERASLFLESSDPRSAPLRAAPSRSEPRIRAAEDAADWYEESALDIPDT